jgi:hypothetical protein
MVIESGGNVGIGTPIPAHKLTVVDMNTSTSWVVTRFIGSHPTTSHFLFQNENDGIAAVQVRGKEVAGVKYINFQIEPNTKNRGGIVGNVDTFYFNVGNVGIGTTKPTHILHVFTGGANVKTYYYGLETTVRTAGGWARSMRFRNENDDVTAAFGSVNGDAYISAGFDINTDPTGYQSRILTVTTSGNVGIGTTTPGYQLQLSLNSAAKPGSNTWIVSSDERLKNITGNYTKGLKEILQLNPITYYYKNTADYSFDPRVFEKENIGFSA